MQISAGIDALHRYGQTCLRNDLHRRPSADLLRYRATRSLLSRLELCVENHFAIDASMFSAADLWVLDDLALQMPAERAALASLRSALAPDV